MKFIPSTQSIFLATVTAITFISSSCRKTVVFPDPQNLSNNNLAFLFLTENKIKINQAITVYDSTLIKDSIDFVSPPSDKYYEWKVIPNSECDSVRGDKNKGITSFIFHCSGTYSLTAKIYDPVSQTLIGTTDTLEINVTLDTLHPTQPIKKDDTLTIQTNIAKSHTDTGNEVWVYLNLSSTKSYDNYVPYIQFDYITNISPNNYSFTFSKIRLGSYPFAYGPYNATDKVVGWEELKGLSYGVPAILNITWLGTTYTGTVTLLNENQSAFSWDNSGTVRMY